MRESSAEALRTAGATVDDVVYLDLYSCFASSLHFATDALGIDPTQDARPLTVTGGLPYHGGPGSGYMTHAIATMVDRLRADPGTLGMVSGVGMHMTKHVFGVYSTEPGSLTPPDEAAARQRADAAGRPCAIVDEYEGDAVVATYSVVHGRDGEPEWGLLVCDVGDGARAYARADDPARLRAAEESELVGATVHLAPARAVTPMGEVRVNRAAWR
jgi:acetyl-CoA C-acetyltransferase